MPKYRIEYLSETTDERSVCQVVTPDAETLAEAGNAAFAGFPHAQRSFDALGFQIRDVSTEHEHIVALETVDTA